LAVLEKESIPDMPENSTCACIHSKHLAKND
jgi:hypothetical protein